MLSMVSYGIAGCLLSLVMLAALGVFPLNVYWRAFSGSVWLCIAITLAFGIGNFLYESMRGKLERDVEDLVGRLRASDQPVAYDW